MEKIVGGCDLKRNHPSLKLWRLKRQTGRLLRSAEIGDFEFGWGIVDLLSVFLDLRSIPVASQVQSELILGFEVERLY